MSITAALCKLQNVMITSSPPNGGLMEKISPLRVPVLDGRNRYTPHQPDATATLAAHGQPGLGDDA